MDEDEYRDDENENEDGDENGTGDGDEYEGVYKDIYEEGYDNGYEDGYADGYEDGYEENNPEDIPQIIPRLSYTKSWENPADYATYQTSELQNRADLQSLFTEIETYLNYVLLPRVEQLIAAIGESGEGGRSTTIVVSGAYLRLTGGTMLGPLILSRDPQKEFPLEAATKQYVDKADSAIRTDMNENFSALIQRADAIELLVQANSGDIAALIIRADEIESRVEDAEGNISTLTQTAESIGSRVEDVEGNVSTITQTADEIESRVQDLEGNVSTITQTADEIESRVQDLEGNVSTITQRADEITLSVDTITDHGEVYSRITLKIGPNSYYGYIKMEGNVDVVGQLSADALYTGYGEIAHLSVDTLSTSRRIVRYLAHDTSDDNYIRIYAQNAEWVTGSPTGGTTQATTPDGVPLYWPVDVSGLSLGTDGYPVSAQNERIFTVTTPTSYPVMVYAYEEAVKRSISFEPVNGIYSPIDHFGAGNQQGNNRAWILKTADGFDIRYLTPENIEIGIRMTTDGKVIIDGLEYDADKIRALLGISENGDGLDLTTVNEDGTISGLSVDEDGYTDVSGLRKVVNIDFSRIGLASGAGFSETLDGGVYNAYSVQRDAAGRIVNITDAEGHETVITWGA